MSEGSETVPIEEFDALQREYDDLSMIHHDMVENYDKAARAFNAEISDLTTKILNATHTLVGAHNLWRIQPVRLADLGDLLTQAIKELAP